MQEDIHDLNGNIQTNHKKLQVTSSHDISIKLHNKVWQRIT